MITKVKKLGAVRLRWLLVCLAFVAGGLGAATALFVSSRPFQRTPTAVVEDSIVHVAQLRRPVNILVLGTVVLTSDLPGAGPLPVNNTYWETVDGNLDGQSDTILLIRFDPHSQTITVLSVPRDTQVEIPGVGLSKINAANFVGGAILSAKTVSKLLNDVTIDRYVRVNVNGFAQLIDALGGVDVYVPYDMQYRDDSQRLYINLQKGMQHLDGKRAIQFMRFRQDDLGDIGRLQRQQMLIRALLEQKLNLETVKRVPQLLEVVRNNLDTNLSIEEMLVLVAFAHKTDRSNVQMLMLPGRFSTEAEYNLSYWLPDSRHIKQMMHRYFQVNYYPDEEATDNTTPAHIRVAVQDSLGSSSAVNSLVQKLADRGYAQVFSTQTGWTKPIDRTLIIAQSGDREVAEQVRAALGIGEIVLEATGDIESDVTVRIGRDWLTRVPATPPSPSDKARP